MSVFGSILLKDLVNIIATKEPNSLIRELPRADILGILLEVKQIRLVGWKEEILLYVSDGADAYAVISFWKNHEDNSFANVFDATVYKGQMVKIRNVKLISQDTDDGVRVFYGEIMNDPFMSRTILVLGTGLADLENYMLYKIPLKIDKKLSAVPLRLKGKTVVEEFPVKEQEWDSLPILLAQKMKYFDATNGSLFGNYFEKCIFHYWDWISKQEDTNVEKENEKRCKR